jgi:molybdopterin converting factor small subunit
MEITVLAFGQLAEITGASFLLHDINDTDALSAFMRSAFPASASIPYKIAINKKIITRNTVIDNNSTIALLPPFSGG